MTTTTGRVVLACALALAAGLVTATPADAAAPRPKPKPHIVRPVPDAVSKATATTPPRRTTTVPIPTPVPPADARCGAPDPDPVPDGQPIVVLIAPGPEFTVGAIPSTWWASPPQADPTWRMTFRGLMWVKPLAVRAATDGQAQSLESLVQQSVAFYGQNPDPGPGAASTAAGWDEGTALRRLESMNCLYALTGDEALVPGMEADAAVLLGPRYYGPPNFSVHNHGLMANLQLVRAADLLDRPTWKAKALQRMTDEAPLAFSSQGTSWEQSSMYQGLNADLWERAAATLDASPGSETAAASIRETVADAWAVHAWMTDPDGGIIQVGDSDHVAGTLRPGWTARSFRDDQTGWIIGRWSWADPLASHYSVRYGPPRRAHGHQDRGGGVTYSVAGVRVLVPAGRYTYDGADPFSPYQREFTGQNVAVPSGGTVNLKASAVVQAGVVQAPAHAWTITDAIHTFPHTRNVNVNRDTRTMRVSDDYDGASLWRQSWHLDPAWKLTSRSADDTRLTFEHPDGPTLAVTTTGRVSSVILGQTTPVVAGWHFPKFKVKVPAPEITVRSYGGACTTSFTVTP